MYALFLRRTETGTKSAALNELFTRLSTSGMSQQRLKNQRTERNELCIRCY